MDLPILPVQGTHVYPEVWEELVVPLSFGSADSDIGLALESRTLDDDHFS